MNALIITELEKRRSTLCAQARLKDALLTVTEDDGGYPLYILTRQAFTRQLRDLSDVERLIDTLPKVGRFG